MNSPEEFHSSQNPSQSSDEESVELSETGDASARNKKKKGNAMVFGGFALLLVVAGGVGYKMVESSNHRHNPAPVVAAQDTPPVSVSAPLPTSVAAPASTPAPMAAPVMTPSASDVAAAPGLPNMSLSASGVPVASEAPAASSPAFASSSSVTTDSSIASPTAASTSTVDVAPATSMGMSPAQTPAVALAAPVAVPVTPVVAAPVVVAAPATSTTSPVAPGNTDDLNHSIGKLSDQMGSLESTLKALMTSTNDKIDTTNRNVSSLSTRVDKLEALQGIKSSKTADAPMGASDTVEAKAPTKAVVHHHHGVYVHHRAHVEARSDRSDNTVELLDRQDQPAPLVPHVPMHQDRAPRNDDLLFNKAPQDDVVEKVVPTNYTVKAVLPGRAWVQAADGTSSTYSVGDTLPDGRKVGRIDPDAGVFDSHGHRLPQN